MKRENRHERITRKNEPTNRWDKTNKQTNKQKKQKKEKEKKKETKIMKKGKKGKERGASKLHKGREEGLSVSFRFSFYAYSLHVFPSSYGR